MDSVDKTQTGILPSSRVPCQYFQYVTDYSGVFLSQDIESHLITSLNYNVITPRLRQSERNRASGMLVAATTV